MQYFSAITGLGIYTPIGRNISEFEHALGAGADGISKIERFPTDEFTAKYAGMVDPVEWAELGDLHPDMDQRITMALLSAREALAETDMTIHPPERIGLIFGVCLGKLAREDGFDDLAIIEQETAPLWIAKLQYQAHQLAEHLEIKGPVIAISTACASSNHAIGYAQDLLRFGFIDAAIVAGTSEVTPHMFAGFYGLKNMSDAPCAPYSTPIGLNLGEGAGCMILEKRPADADMPSWGLVTGYGSGSDAHHPTTPDPKGSGVARAINSALVDLGVRPEEIGYINSHGTGTHENDLSEWLGFKQVFGEAAGRIPISSSKSFMGHTGGAAGIIEAIITLIGLKRGFLPPTLHFSKARRVVPDNLITSSKPQAASFRTAITCNSGFGGANAATIFSRNLLESWEPSKMHEISVLGVGSISHYGLNALDRVLENTSPALTKTKANADGYTVPDEAVFVPEMDLSEYTSIRDTRFLDPITSHMVTASMLAQSDFYGNGQPPDSEHMAVLTGVSHIPSTSLHEFRNSIRERGVLGIAAHAFAKVVMNASMGGVCEILGIKGQSNTIAAAEGAGLFSIAEACMLLSRDANTSTAYAVAADELGDIPLAMHHLLDRKYLPTEGAGSVLLARSHDLTSDVRIGGVGLAGPSHLDEAISHACAGIPAFEIPVVMLTDDGDPDTQTFQRGVLKDFWGPDFQFLKTFNPASIMGYGDASTSMFAFILAVEALRKKQFKTHTMRDHMDVNSILIIHNSSLNGSCAIRLESNHG